MLDRGMKIKDIVKSVRFYQLLVSNLPLTKTVVSYLTIDDFSLQLINALFETRFEVSHYLELLYEPFEITDHNKRVIIQLVLENRKETLDDAILEFDALRSTNPKFKNYRLMFILIGLGNVSLNGLPQLNDYHHALRRDILSFDQVINLMYTLVHPWQIENIQSIVHGYAGKFDILNQEPRELVQRIVTYLSTTHEIYVTQPSVLSPNMYDLLNNSLNEDDVKKLPADTKNSMLEVLNAYAMVDGTNLKVINNVYALIRKTWIRNFNQCRTNTRKVVDVFIADLQKMLIQDMVISDNECEDAKEILHAVVLESLIRSYVTVSGCC